MNGSSGRSEGSLSAADLDRLAPLVEAMVHAGDDDPEVLLLRLLDHAVAVLGAEGGSIMVVAQPHTLMLRVMRGRLAQADARAYVPFGQSIAGRVAETGAGMVVQDVPEGLTGYISKTHPPRSAVCVPIWCDGRVAGVLNLNLWTADRRFGEIDLQIARLLAIQLAWAFTLNRRLAEIWQIAKVDGLTGLATRWHFKVQLDAEIARSARQDLQFCVVMIDLDGFKQINTRYGHLAADGVLRELSRVIEANVRGMDLVARFGGDEFVLLLPEADIETALQVVWRLQSAVAAHRFAVPRDESIGLSLCGGIAQHPLDGHDAEDLLHAADLALMDAKRRARGAVSVGTPGR